MALEVDELAQKMVEAIGGVLVDYWDETKPYAEEEAQKLAQSLQDIEKLFEDGTITAEKAIIQLDMQKKAAQAVFLTVEGLSIIAAENAINAGLGVVRDAVNAVLPIELL